MEWCLQSYMAYSFISLYFRISRIPHEDVFCQAIKKCDNEKWDLLFSFYSPKNWKNTNDIILSVLACTSSTEKLTQ